MSKKFQLQIPEPCHEDWNKMTPVDKGRFCDSCQKAVVDFTGMSDAQLVAFFKKPSTGSVCGRFFDEQLDRDFDIPRKRIPWLKYLFQVSIPVFLTGMKTQAQGKVLYKEKITGDTIVNCAKPFDGVIYGNAIPMIAMKKISGRIIDDKNNAVPYATVYLKGTKEGTVCDRDGFFNLEYTGGERKVALTISCVGYSTVEKQINIRKVDFAKIRLSTNFILNGEVVVTGHTGVRKGAVMGSYSIRRSYLQKVTDLFKEDSINVFPNPAKAGGEIKIEWKQKAGGEYSIDLFGLQGQLIQTTSAMIGAEMQAFNLRLPIITPGTYLLRLTDKKTGKFHTEKIIIQ